MYNVNKHHFQLIFLETKLYSDMLLVNNDLRAHFVKFKQINTFKVSVKKNEVRLEENTKMTLKFNSKHR
jgi:hypothetical protein